MQGVEVSRPLEERVHAGNRAACRRVIYGVFRKQWNRGARKHPSLRVGWLHLSDLHVKASGDNWAQDVVLRDLVASVEQRVAEGYQFDFVLVTGDLAFSGQPAEYETVAVFLDAILNIVALPRSALCCVPGNHDVDRAVQKTCYSGARATLTSPTAIDTFLGDPPEREALLERLSAFHALQSHFAAEVSVERSSDGLGYVWPLDIRGLPVAIVGLNSAWLCGDASDERNIAIGDRQTVDLQTAVKAQNAALRIAIAHHPPDWLQRFDQVSFERRLLAECDFFHRGHLHVPQVASQGQFAGRSCVLVGAGAAYARRDFENSYASVELDIENARCELRHFRYAHGAGTFDIDDTYEGAFVLRGSIPGTPQECAQCFVAFGVSDGVASYLAALLHGYTRDVPAAFEGKVMFVDRGILDRADEGDWRTRATEFVNTGSLLLGFDQGMTLAQRAEAVAERIRAYAEWLSQQAEASEAFAADLARRNGDFREMFGEAVEEQHDAVTLMDELANQGEWDELLVVAEGQLSRRDPTIVRHAERLRGIAFCRSEREGHNEEGLRVLHDLAASEEAEAQDVLIASRLLHDDDQTEAAVSLLLNGIERLGSVAQLFELGYTIALDVGDEDLRATLDELRQRAE